ncbi:MAG: hypothetical protein IT454_04505 [Planctomycetes bacterium]|nr:hypothetical protein [Planctomycetota bacterium]
MFVACLVWMSSAFVSLQEPAAAPALQLRVGQTAPELEECTWARGVDSPRPGVIVKKSGGEFGGDLPIDPTDLEAAVQSLGAPRLRELAGRVVIVHALDSHDPQMIATGLLTLRDLEKAAADRGLLVITLCDANDVEGAQRALEYAEMNNPLGSAKTPGTGLYFDRERHGSRAGFVVGRSGELCWKGDLVADTKAFCAALELALGRVQAPRIERTVDGALEATLADYWNGKFEKARAALKKLAKSPEQAPAARTDAEHVIGLIDAHERDLVARAHQAAAAQAIEKLVELDAILQAGFDKPTKLAAQEELKRIDATTMNAGRTADARKWAELSGQRPLFFPARNDAEGKRFAKAVEAFLRATPNDTKPTQTAKALLARFKALP